MTPLEQVDDVLTRAGTFYLATVEGERPRCRPLAFHLLHGGRLYFAVGDFKAVYRQMQQNPRVEICAVADGTFLRYYGRAVFDSDPALAERVLDAMPAMRRLYNEQTGCRLALFSLTGAVAEFRDQLTVRQSYRLD